MPAVDATLLIRGLLARAATRGIRDIGPTKLCGLVYLIDVEHYERYGRTASGIKWIWHHRGPFSSVVAYGPRDDPQIGTTRNFNGNAYRLLVEQTIRLEERIVRVVDEVLEEHGHKTAVKVKRYCYRSTEPMLAVQATGERGDVLDFSTIPHEPADPDVLAELSLLKRLGEPRQHVDPIHGPELLEIVEETELTRRRASNRLIS